LHVDMTNDDPPVPTAQPTRSWVWGCSDESIAVGHISVLAVAEVVAAVALYWWLASHFDWPWMAFIGLIAAPMLLLRSPESVEHGVAMLGRYWNRKEEALSRWEKIIIALISSLTAGLAVYWLATSWLPGWGFYWRAAALGTIAFVIAIVIAGMNMSAGAGAGAGAMRGALSGAIVGAGVGAGVAAGVTAGLATWVAVGVAAGVVLGALGAVRGSNNKAAEETIMMFLAPFLVLGILLRGLLIRWIATLCHLLAGLAHLPQNWRETLLVIDLLHPPELLPQAGRINSYFTVRSVWRYVIKKPASNAWEKIFSLMLLLAWYLPALAYRWSLKASAWLWWPLALALSSPLERLDGRRSREKTAQSVGGAWRWLLVVPAVVFAWLILSALPGFDFLLTMLPEEATKLAKKLLNLASPPPFSVRYVALWLVCILALVFWWQTKDLKASHSKVLESPKEFNELSSEDKERFLQLARPIEKLRLLLIVTVLVLVEAYTVSFFHSVNPQLAEKLVAPWLLRVL
jgi:hypothetical protein